jgi:hypothetical protein
MATALLGNHPYYGKHGDGVSLVSDLGDIVKLYLGLLASYRISKISWLRCHLGFPSLSSYRCVNRHGIGFQTKQLMR